MFDKLRLLCLAVAAAASLAAATNAFANEQAGSAERCLMLSKSVAWPETGTRVLSTSWNSGQRSGALSATSLPDHCELVVSMRERLGYRGQKYAIRMHLRLPANWNERFFMQGGGGTNGDLGDALGQMGEGRRSALAQGYAVVSQDSGHDNAVNTVPSHGGASAFGFDPQARADYGGASLPPVVLAAKAIVRSFYGRDARYSYFSGCSKGGQEGMMLAQRYPGLFDGIVSGAPGFALPRVAVAVAWDLQRFAEIASAQKLPITASSLGSTFSNSDFALLGRQILRACDRDDGLADGIVGNFSRCTSARVLPLLNQVRCPGEKANGCLSGAQISALTAIHQGVRSREGRRLYSGYPWDAGWADAGWRIWKTGEAGAPSIDLAMGIPALASIFITPPRPLATQDQAIDFALRFDFDRDAPAIYQTGSGFSRSAWQDIGARSPDMSGFRERGGKMIVFHGVSDPIFSVDDTISWYREVDQASGGNAGQFVRLFAVPGMGHCAGGPATDNFDAFSALVEWVERAQAPERLIAAAGKTSPWPRRTRPICAYPAIARYSGSGSIDDARNFVCR